MEKDIVPKFGFKFVGLNIAPPRTLKIYLVILEEYFKE